MTIEYTNQEITGRAQLARQRISAENGPVDAQIVAESYGLGVKFASFDNTAPECISDNVAAFYDQETHCIVINDDLSGNEVNFFIAVELGKYLLFEAWVKSPSYMLTERKTMRPGQQQEAAETFARALLVSQKMLTKFRQVADASSLSRLFCLPIVELAKEVA